MSFLFSFLHINPVFAQSDNKNKKASVYDFSDDWLTYHPEEKVYLPLVSDQGLNAVFLSLSLNQYSHYIFFAKVKSSTLLFIDNRLTKKISAGSDIIFDIDSLKQATGQNKITLIFYRLGGPSEMPQAWILDRKEHFNYNRDQKETDKNIQINRREKPSFHNYIVIAFVFLFISFAFLVNTYPKAFEQYYQLKNIFGVVEKFSILKLGRVQLLFILNHSLLLSLGLSILRKLFAFYSHSDFIQVQSLQLLMYNWIAWAVLIFCLIVGKYILINILGNLLKSDKIVPVHFYRHLSISQVFYLFFFFCLFFIFVAFPSFLPGLYLVSLYVLVSFNLIRSVIIIMGLNKIMPFYNMYFFSYLCATEAVPVLLGFKYFNQIL